MENCPPGKNLAIDGVASNMVSKVMYNPNRLEWHRDDELVKTPQVSVWSCRTASESFDQFNRLAVALAKSQDHRASCGVFAFGRPSDSRYVTGPAWGDKSRNTDSRTHPLICRTALVERLLKHLVHGGTRPDV